MSTFLERLNEEANDLASKMLKLGDFIGSENFGNIDEVQQILLQVQIKAMDTYLQCLRERLYQLSE